MTRARLLALGLPSALLLSAAPASAASLTVPAPAPGQVNVGIAKAGGGLGKLRVAGVPAGAVVLGGVDRGRLVVAVARPSSAKGRAGKVVVRTSRGRLRGPVTSTSLFTSPPSGAAASAARPACGGSAPRRVLARGKGSGRLAAGDLGRLARLVEARLCGRAPDATGRTLLGLLGLTTDEAAPDPGPGPAPSPVAPAPPAGPASDPAPAAPPAPPATAPKPSPSPPPSPAPSPPPGNGNGNGGTDGVQGACANGKDDDGDGQVDDVEQGATFFDPGCTSPADTTEGSEKATPRSCGLGVATYRHRYAFIADFDSISSDLCPKGMRHGYVDLAAPVEHCGRAMAEGEIVLGCTVEGGAVEWHGDATDQWAIEALHTADLCGQRAVLVGIDSAGQAWEQHVQVFDGAEVCAGAAPPRPVQCADGIDNDYDGQIDTGTVGGRGIDPGCDSASDTTEGSESPFGLWGCFGVVAHDPDAPGTIDFHLASRVDGECPEVDRLWVSFADAEIAGCATVPSFGGAAGDCATVEGDVVLSGPKATGVAVRLTTSKRLTCDDVFGDGQVDIRVGTSLHEAVFSMGYYDDQGRLRSCD